MLTSYRTGISLHFLCVENIKLLAISEQAGSFFSSFAFRRILPVIFVPMLPFRFIHIHHSNIYRGVAWGQILEGGAGGWLMRATFHCGRQKKKSDKPKGGSKESINNTTMFTRCKSKTSNWQRR
jgi:hypothetical protein